MRCPKDPTASSGQQGSVNTKQEESGPTAIFHLLTSRQSLQHSKQLLSSDWKKDNSCTKVPDSSGFGRKSSHSSLEPTEWSQKQFSKKVHVWFQIRILGRILQLLSGTKQSIPQSFQNQLKKLLKNIFNTQRRQCATVSVVQEVSLPKWTDCDSNPLTKLGKQIVQRFLEFFTLIGEARSRREGIHKCAA